MNEFYKRFCELCAQKNVSASGAAIAIGLSNAAASGWKKGKLPSDVTCEKLAAYFDVDINYLMCDQKENPATESSEVNKETIALSLEKMSTSDLVSLMSDITDALKKRETK